MRDLRFAERADDPKKDQIVTLSVYAKTQLVKYGRLNVKTLVKILEVRYVGKKGTLGRPPKLMIKLEVDSNPPEGATYASGTLLFPFPVSVRNFDHESSFAGKMHALLCRTYIKGRDWFDFIWYMSSSVKINHRLLTAAIDQQGQWAGKHVVTSDEWVRGQLKQVIEKMDWEAARRDVLPFVYASDRPSLDLWGREFFQGLAERIGK